MPLRAEPLAKARKAVAMALQSLGVDPAKAAQGEDSWIVGKRSAAVLLRLVPQEEETKPAHLQVVSPLMRAPADPRFRERLLHLNHELGGLAAFGITSAGEVQLLCARSVENLSPAEVAQLVAQVAHFSDQYDDALLDEFGREHALRPEQRRPDALGAAPPAPAPASKPGKKPRKGA